MNGTPDPRIEAPCLFDGGDHVSRSEWDFERQTYYNRCEKCGWDVTP